MNNPLEAVTQAVNSLVTALKLPDESAKANEVLGEMSFPQFSRLLPYRDYNQESGLFMNDTTMGFMLEAIPINGANESIVEALDHMLRTKLPRGVPFCIHLMSSQLVGDRIEYGLREFSWSGEQAERFNAITRAYYMNAAATQFPLPEGMNLPLTLRHYRVFFSYCSPSKKKSRADILEMENLVKIIRASLQGASITTQAVDAQAFIDIVGEMINHNPDSLYPKRRQLDPYSDLNYQCVEDSFDLKVRADYLTLGLREKGRNSTARILNFHLARNPEIAFLWNMADNYSNLLNPELSISCPFILTLTLVVEDQVKTHSEANLKYMDLEKKSKTSYAKWFPSVEKEAKEWGELRQRLGSGQSSVVSYFLNITAFCKDNNETALEVEQDILNSFRKNGFELISPRFNHMRNFLTCLPFMAGKGLFKQLKEAGVVQRAESFNVANLMPLVADNPLTPAGLLAPTYRNQLAFIDIFFRGMNNTNYNMAVCGTSGAGKTGLIQPLIRSVLDSGGFAVVFDMGDGYKSLCENMGGVYLDGETLRFNPFANITDIDQSAERVRDQLSVMASPNGNLDEVHEGLLLQAVRASWLAKKNRARIDDVVDFLKNARDNDQYVESPTIRSRLDEMIVLLDQYTAGGTYGRYFNSDEPSLRDDAKMVVLELGGLEDRPSLLVAVMFSLIIYIENRMYRTPRNLKKLNVIDEGWRLLDFKNHKVGEFIEKGYRTARRHTGAYITITQNIVDFDSDKASSAARAAWGNSSYKIILKQSAKEFAKYNQLYPDQFLPLQRDMIGKFGAAKDQWFSSFLLQVENHSSWHRLFVDPLSRAMYSSDGPDFEFVQQKRKEGLSIHEAVTAQSHSLTLRDAQGETQVVRISSLDSSWSLFRPEKMPVADGERLRVTGKIPGLRVSGGDRLQVTSVSEDAMTVVVPGRAEPASLPVADSPFTALKLENGWVETPGHSVSDSATVFASVTQMAMDNATLNGLARSGRDVRLYSSLDETRTAEKLARHPSFTVVSEQIKARAGEILLETAISLQKAGLHTPAQQAIHLALPVLESKNLAFSMVDLLTEAKSFAAEGTSFTDLGGEINAQIKRGDLLYVDVAKGYGTGLLVSRASYEAEKSILRHILEGKEAVTPLMERVPGELMEKLTSGQRAATRMILETSDRFTVVQGYAGVGKTTQFRAVMSAVNMLPESGRPRVVGLGPTHRAVGEMRSAGVDAQTLASFLHDTQLQQRSGETPDFSNTLFLLDESSMVGNTDMARAYALIAAGGGRAVASGDTDQLQAIAPGQPFRLQQTRSAADVAIMKEIVRQTPELREAVYSLINRDVERALSGLESVKPSQVPRQEGAWAPEHSVTEFSHSQEAKLAEAQQKAMLKGEAFPDVPMTLYEAIVRDYTGRTPEAREQTLIVTHLNEDRRVLNSMIHDAREKAGELGKEQVMVPVLNTANIRDGELRRLSTWETHRDALVLVDNVYHRIAGISKDDGLITLQDAEGNTRLISPREAVAEGVTLYTPDTIRVGAGDRMRFTKSDRERGYVANSVWTVTAVSGDSVTLSGRQQTRVIRPAQERAEQHIDLAYAITAHGAQGASETFAIALEGTEGSRKLMAGFESAYVALSRMKQHVQVYTDNRQGWTDAINNAVQKGTAHDVFEPKPDREVMNAERLFSTARELRDVAAGRAVLRQAGLAGGDSPARFIAPGRKYPQPYVALPAFDRNGKSAGIWLNPLTTDDGNGLRGFSGEGRVKGSGDAQFVALQGSRNGESLLADNMQDGVRIARDNPDSGVVVRIAGEGRPWNPGAITGGRVWGDIPDNSVQPGAGNGEPVTAEVLAQRQAEEAIRRETVRRADEIVRKMAENKPDLPDSKTEQAVREIAGQERDRSAISEREAALPESVLRESQREREAVREIARENLLQERLQQMERDMVRDLQKEKTLGGD
ncbi:type IV secretion system protein TraC [Escherichia coli]|uniref:type IV secretion system protein TraC n=1 Tax=Escherichia coli TaxID=562 RepID=UPI000DDE1014|nr:type IV secretion system protein TraC [Escherichia coli]